MSACLRTVVLSVLLALGLVCSPQSELPPHIGQPQVEDLFGAIPSKFTDYDVILRPDREEPEWWAGAPSVAVGDDGTLWMACRMRTAQSDRGVRGYEIRILKSSDGVRFEKVKSIRREDVPIPGFERPALVVDPTTRKFKLYGCGPWKEGPWSIIKWADADSPADIDPASAYPVIQPASKAYERDTSVTEYKDPFILYADGKYHCYVIGYIRRNEWTFHFESIDGETWEPVGNPNQPVLSLAGWHNFFVRPSCVVPLGAGYLFVYEGSSSTWYDPVYNVVTGLAHTFDLHRMIDLTPDAPLAVSDTPNDEFSTFRYSHWLDRGDELWVYVEAACPDKTHEIRRYRLKK